MRNGSLQNVCIEHNCENWPSSGRAIYPRYAAVEHGIVFHVQLNTGHCGYDPSAATVL